MPQTKAVIVAERSNLGPVKVFISNSFIYLELFEDREGNLFISSPVSSPEGQIYYATTPSSFCAFMEGLITLQTLFIESPSLFVEISNEGKTALYSRNDIDIVLTCGDKTITELSAGGIEYGGDMECAVENAEHLIFIKK